LYELFNPFKRSDGTFAPAYATLIEFGVPQYIPDRKIQGVELSAAQYNRMIEIATDGGNLAKRIDELGKSREILSLAGTDLAAAQTLIAQEISQAYSMAREMLVLEDQDLSEAINSIKEAQRDSGKYKR
jgi:hypothetical protein